MTKDTGGKKHHRPKWRPSLSTSITVVGGAITITGVGVATVTQVLKTMNASLKQAGITIAITGATVVGVAWLLRGWAALNLPGASAYKRSLREVGMVP